MRLIRVAVLAAALALAGTGAVCAQDEDADPGATAFNNGDYAGAMAAWRPKADAGDPDAMTKVGTLYNLGLGVNRDIKQAAQWYERAAQLGFVTAQFDLANLYYDGHGFPHDLKQAARWYTAAAQGGHAKAQLYLAEMYENGDGVEKNQDTAVQWYQKAADQELPEAEYLLGKKLVYGDGVGKDPVKGPDLLLKAADQQYAKKNLIEAYVWASQAVMNAKVGRDASRAQTLLEDIKSGMTGDELKAGDIELQAVHPTKKKDAKDGTGGSDNNGTGGAGSSDSGNAPQ